MSTEYEQARSAAASRAYEQAKADARHAHGVACEEASQITAPEPRAQAFLEAARRFEDAIEEAWLEYQRHNDY